MMWLAEQFPEAQFRLGVSYDAGKGVRQDYCEATKWYSKAAEQGMPGDNTDSTLCTARC